MINMEININITTDTKKMKYYVVQQVYDIYIMPY